MKIRSAVAALLFATSASSAFAAPATDPSDAEPGHVVGTPSEGSGALSREEFEARFGTDAARLLAQKPDARADRFAAYDMAWPRNAEEAKRLGGNTVIVLGALSHDASELPLSKAYLELSDGRIVELQRLGFVSRSLASSSQAAKVFGPNLSEEFYLLPISALGRNVTLKCDFAKKRMGFVLSKSLVPLRDSPWAQSPSRQPLAAAVGAMVAREYPGFGVSLAGGAK
jgi:hypothetical protein